VGASNLPPIQECVGPIRDARVVLDAHRRERNDKRQEADHEYHPCHGERYDINEDRSPSPPPSGPQAFAQHILHALFPQRYHMPTSILTYFGESNLGLWLEKYQLAC
jgi:hypothetical protein